ncbi:MAG: hypothetical protein AB9Q19_01315 [Candidatus Reddybacter sp.]
MAAYPSVSKRTTVIARAALIIDASVSGAVRAVDLSAEDIFEIEVVHPYINSTDHDTLITFYDTNKALVVALSAGDGNTYDVLFEARPTVEVINGSWYNVTANMVGNKQ